MPRPLSVLLMAVSLFASAPLTADHAHDDVRTLRNSGQILPLETIIDYHRRRNPGGQLLEVALELKRGHHVYELKILDDDGEVREFEYDARTGQLWGLEREDRR